MNECFQCDKEIKDKTQLKIFHGKWFHKKCLRKLRKKAKKKYYGNLDQALKEIKENKRREK